MLIILLFALIACQEDNENGEGTVLGPAAADAAIPGLFRFWGDIRSDLVSSCGTASAATTTGTTTTTTTPMTRETANTATAYNISSFYTFTWGETMLLKYVYYTNRDKFNLVPLQTETTCKTNDYIHCVNAGTDALYICTTTDMVNCGGAQTFTFISPSLKFQGRTGTIEWTKFSLNDESTAVNQANLKINMISAEGSVFVGEVSCISDK